MPERLHVLDCDLVKLHEFRTPGWDLAYAWVPGSALIYITPDDTASHTWLPAPSPSASAEMHLMQQQLLQLTPEMEVSIIHHITWSSEGFLAALHDTRVYGHVTLSVIGPETDPASIHLGQTLCQAPVWSNGGKRLLVHLENRPNTRSSLLLVSAACVEVMRFDQARHSFGAFSPGGAHVACAALQGPAGPLTFGLWDSISGAPMMQYRTKVCQAMIPAVRCIKVAFSAEGDKALLVLAHGIAVFQFGQDVASPTCSDICKAIR